MTRLQEKYKKEVIPAMKEKFGYKNDMAVPRIKKVVVNSCFGKDGASKTGQEREKIQKTVLGDMASILGQMPRLIKSKKSISSFKLRKNIEIAAAATLRKGRMYDFLERLIYLTLPRSRDFRGINPKSVDQRGNLTIGFREHIAFPEIITERERTIFGLEVTVVANAKSREEGIGLYRLMGFPIKNE